MRIQRYVLVPFVALLVGCVEGGNAGNKPSDTSPIDASNDSLNTVVDTLVSGDSVVASDVSVDGGAPADAIQDMANPQDTAPDTSLPEDVGVTVDAGAEDMATAENTAEPPPKELCAAVDEKAEWELCDSGPDFCAVVFTDEAGCSAVCETLGLECYATWDNISDECAPNTTLPPLTCDPPSNHQSDYCVCRTVDSPCEPQCDGKACGDDGCGGPCGSCDQGVPCVDNQCSCVPKTCESELFHCGANHDDDRRPRRRGTGPNQTY